jgi:hypothetical protein
MATEYTFQGEACQRQYQPKPEQLQAKKLDRNRAFLPFVAAVGVYLAGAGPPVFVFEQSALQFTTL